MSVLRRSTIGLVVILVVAATLAPTSPAAYAKKKKSATPVSYTYDADGQLATVTSGKKTATYTYDAVGNLLSIKAKKTKKAAPRAATRSNPGPESDPPVVDGLEPATARSGTRVTVTGHGFRTDRSLDVVKIGHLFAQVVTATSTKLRVIVPPGSVGGRVEVSTPGGSSGPASALSVPGARSGGASSAILDVMHTTRTTSRPEGITALAGQVRTTAGAALAGVTVSISNGWDSGLTTTRTKSNGRFFLTDLTPGRHQLVLNGTTAGPYGVYHQSVTLAVGRTNTLTWTSWMDPQEPANSVAIASPTPSQVVVRAPQNPDFEIIIPKGTVITDSQGHPVTRLTITPVPVDRTPVPLAPGMPAFFDVQPGDATVSGPGLQVIYPNDSGQPAGTPITYASDTAYTPGTGWATYGSGHVSPDATQILPTAGTRVKNLVPFTYYQEGDPDAPPVGGSCQCGDPVDLSTGLFMYSNTDLALSDVIPISVTRTYRQDDPTIRDFGMGQTDNYQYYITSGQGGDLLLVTPDGSAVTYQPTSNPNVYDALTTPSAWTGSQVDYVGTDDVSVTLVDGTVYTFGTNHVQLTGITDRFGNTVSITRNDLDGGTNSGEIEQVTSPNGEWMDFTYSTCVPGESGNQNNATKCVTSITDNLGRTTSYTYDSDGRMLTATDPGGNVTTYTWAPCTTPGSLQCTELDTITDARGYVVADNTYNGAGQVTNQTSANGGTYQFAYASISGGTQTTVTDPLGDESQFDFDANNYETSQTLAYGTPDAQTTTLTRGPTSQFVTQTTDPLGRVTSYTYNQNGDVLTETQLAGTANAETTTYTYEPTYDRLASVTDPMGHTTTLTYDDPANLATQPDVVSVTDPLGHTTTVTLSQGQPVKITDPLGNTSYASYLNGLLVAETDPLGNISAFYNDGAGRVLQATDPEGKATSYAYDNDNQLTQTTDPLGHTTKLQYDADGDITKLTDANGHSTTYTYDNEDELSSTTNPLGDVDTYTYDLLGDELTYTDGNGHESTFAYDALDRLTDAQYGVVGASAQSSTTYSYDAGNRLTQAVDSVAGTYGFIYDGLNDVLSASSPQGTVSYTYDAAGLETTMTVPNQAQTNYTYNDDELLTGIVQGTSSVAFDYDADQRPTSSTLPDGVVRSATYNAGSQLTGLSFADGSDSLGTLTYAYDADSDITGITGSLSASNLPAPATNTFNADNELIKSGSSTLTYDDNGNLTSNGPDAYTWNDRDQLTAISGPSTSASFIYDPFNRQASDTVDGTATSFLYDGENVVQQLSGDTATAKYLTGGLDQTFQVQNSAGTSSLLTNQLGSTIALANSSARPTTTTAYTYGPNGAVTTSGAANPSPIQYAGTQNDGTGLYSMGARYYSPAEDSFISQDPIGFLGGQTDLYGYVGDDPVNWVDPSGMFKVGVGYTSPPPITSSGQSNKNKNPTILPGDNFNVDEDSNKHGGDNNNGDDSGYETGDSVPVPPSAWPGNNEVVNPPPSPWAGNNGPGNNEVVNPPPPPWAGNNGPGNNEVVNPPPPPWAGNNEAVNQPGGGENASTSWTCPAAASPPTGCSATSGGFGVTNYSCP